VIELNDVVVAIPSYDRPTVLDIALKRLANLENINKIVVVADSSSEQVLKAYGKVLEKYKSKIIAHLRFGHYGSVNARNALLELLTKNPYHSKYVLLMDDDHLVPNENVIKTMVYCLRKFEEIGVVGARVITLRKQTVDPEFALPVTARVANLLTEVSGFIFNGRWNKAFFSTATSSFMLIRANLLGKVSYDPNYQGTGYREETDLQLQIARHGFKILSDPKVYVYHLALETGGTREHRYMGSRMYWKARNHTYFTLKWHSHKLGKTLWYILMGAVVLTLYRPLYFHKILSGLEHGYKLQKSCQGHAEAQEPHY
jgi:GT2 family glycosyltransferase